MWGDMLKIASLMFTTLLLASGALAQESAGIAGMIYGTVNVRSGPGTQYEIVGQLAQGDAVLVTARDSEAGRWLLIEAEPAVSGWVGSFMVVIESDPSALPVVDQTLETSGVTVRVVAFGRVNVRSGPGMEYELVGQLDVGDEADALARSNDESDWLYIQRAEFDGWVAYFAVQIEGNPAQLPIRTVDATGEGLVGPAVLIATRFNVRLHPEPLAGSRTVGIVPFESSVTLLARSSDSAWLYVAYEDLVGWGATALFEFSEDQLSNSPIYAPREPEATATVSPPG